MYRSQGLTPEWVIKVGGSLGERPASLRRLMETLWRRRAGGAGSSWCPAAAPSPTRCAAPIAASGSATRPPTGWPSSRWTSTGTCSRASRPGRLSSGAARELAPGRLNVLAPSAWLLGADPLPHSWDVTSDSIAAWVARALRVRRLMLVKDVDGFLAPRRGAKHGRGLMRVWRGTRSPAWWILTSPGSWIRQPHAGSCAGRGPSGSCGCWRPAGPTGPRSSASAKPAGAGLIRRGGDAPPAHLLTRSGECVAERALPAVG